MWGVGIQRVSIFVQKYELAPLYNFFKNKRTHKALSNV